MSDEELVTVRRQDLFFAWAWTVEALAHPAFKDAVSPETRAVLEAAMERLYAVLIEAQRKEITPC